MGDKSLRGTNLLNSAFTLSGWWIKQDVQSSIAASLSFSFKWHCALLQRMVALSAVGKSSARNAAE
jgi:hypothetical protein